jgi:hypothetical protein
MAVTADTCSILGGSMAAVMTGDIVKKFGEVPAVG